MIITRTPLRISLGGGGTDLPSYYTRREGFVLAGAIDKYVFIGINRTFGDDYTIKYSSMEHAATIDEIRHPIVREVMAKHQVPPAIEVISLADIPAGTGLGSSGTFTVGLLRAIYALRREHVTAGDLAEEACHIEIERLAQSVGKQDQYIASFGGLTCFDFRRDGTVESYPLLLSDTTLHDLEENLAMFFTGYSRQATEVLSDQRRRSEQGDEAMLDNLDSIKALGFSIKKALEQGETHLFAELMHEHWVHKRERSAGISNTRIDHWYDVGMANGALGGKLIGAGAGGFLLFYAKDRLALRRAMAEEGLSEVRFTFDHEGSQLIVRA
ncbi:MAG TPA: galactokinase [Acidimicrobiales bacterium]|nr:galactokinase [Acidimicrobiales bacterium]